MYSKSKFYSNYFKLTFIILIILTALVAIFYSFQKSGYIMDENFTYGLSNSYFQPFPYRFNEWVPSTFYENYLAVSPGERFSFDSVYYNQVNDVHPPLFYYLVHFISSIFMGSYSKWIVISLNVFFLLVTFIVVFKLTTTLIDNRWYALLISSFWSLSVGAISSVIFLRMYVMLTFFFTILLYFGLKFILIEEKKKTTLFLISLTLVTGSLTHYYFLVYSFFLIATMTMVLIFIKRYKDMLVLGISSLFSIGIFYLLFPSVVDHLQNSGRGKEAVSNLTTGSSNLLSFLRIINEDLFAGMGLYLIVAIISIFLLRLTIFNKISQNNSVKFNPRIRILQYTLILIPVIFYILLIQRIAPYQTSRYVNAVYPIIIIGVSLIIIDLLNLVINRPKVEMSLTVGLISLVTTLGLLVQGVSYTGNNYKTIESIIAEHAHLDVLVLTNARWRIVGYVNELVHYSNVYPQLVSNEEIKLPEDSILKNSDELVIYIDSRFSNRIEEIIKLLEIQYGYTTYRKLYAQSYNMVYLFEK